MKLLKIFSTLMLLMSLFFVSCKPKDSDIRESIEKKLQANPQTAATSVTVDDGVATLGGELASNEAKMESERTAAGVKGVKSVVNSITVASVEPTVTAPVTIAADDQLTTSVNDAVKDFPGVTATVNDGVVTLNGEVTKEQNRKIMMSISGLNPKKVDNKLTIK